MSLVPMKAILDATEKYNYAQDAFNVNAVCQAKYAEEIHDVLVRFTRALFKGMDWGSKVENYETAADYCSKQTKASVESQLMQVGDAHWFNLDDLKADVADGTIRGYYENIQNDMVMGENIKPATVFSSVQDAVRLPQALVPP